MSKKGAKDTAAALPAAVATPPDFWADRIRFFEEMWSRQQAEYAVRRAPIKITLPDGKIMDAEAWHTTPIDIARQLSNSLPDKVIVAKVDDELWDLTRPLEKDCAVELLDWDDKDARKVFWHSSSHVLGFALEKTLHIKLVTGPALEEGGFFYEGQTSRPVTDADFDAINKAMAELVKAKAPYQRLMVSKADALRMFGYNPFKTLTLGDKVPEGGLCSVYRCGDLIDPCRGPHVPDTGRIKATMVVKNSSSYFRGDAKNESLQRVYGMSFPKEALLKEWKAIQEEAAKRDHRVIGKQQELFQFSDVSPGSAFWFPHGLRIYNGLIDFQKKEYRKRGFSEVMSPNIYNAKLWMVSGHWDKYADDMFCCEVEKEDYALKPMNCPGHCIMFGMRARSYRELPIRFAEFGVLHRNELSGALTGLTRVRRFQQDDAHIFCRIDQLKTEIDSALEFLNHVYKILGFKFSMKLSTRPENFLGQVATWDQAEGYLRQALNAFNGIPDAVPDPTNPGATFVYDGKPASAKKMKQLMTLIAKKGPEAAGGWAGLLAGKEAWEENPGDGAFYGPKIDIVVEDALKRRHQCATIQLDFVLPERFGLKYTLAQAKEQPTGAAAAAAAATADGVTSAAAAASAPAAPAPPPAGRPARVVQPLMVDRHLEANQDRPVMIHRAIFGSLERCIAILCEHFGGKWPFWLSPRQICVIPVAATFEPYAEEVRNLFFGDGFYADVDASSSTLDKKIRDAQIAQYNMILVVGQDELEARSANVRTRDNQRHGAKSLDELMAWFKKLRDEYVNEF